MSRGGIRPYLQRFPLGALILLLGCSRPAVIVIGGGPAGLAAAIEAAGDHRPVRLYEARAEVGGSASFGDAVTAIPSPDALRRLDAANGTSNAARTRFVTRVRADVVDWLGGMGQVWRPLPNDAEPDVELMTPAGRGQSIVGFLAQAAADAGVDVHVLTRVTGLKRDGDGITVTLQPGGTVRATAVVIATGGFAGNLERVRQRLDLDASIPLLRGATDFADGNGIDLGLAVGGVERLPGQVLLYAHGVPDPDHAGAALMFVDGDRALGIDSVGTLFDEVRTPRGDSGMSLLARPGGTGWVIINRRAEKEIQLWSADQRSFVPASEIGARGGRRGDDAMDLARRLGVPADALVAAVQAEGVRPTASRPLRQGPLTALPLRLTTAKSLTGLQIDLDGHLLDASGAIIPRLYAAGEAAGFAHPWEAAHVDSTMVSGAILTGRAAGEAIVRDFPDGR